ncbi:hypothetical protein Tsubulata_007921 [Turnera subulata]|uniref:RRM domain-containing protein n=1 Tax=Turnera subulata TaxID=218843 RepID=A0A9Q0JBA1_9ROSI|nr:hypothetical protein Tsubulata_007921 [Turnera subulata]
MSASLDMSLDDLIKSTRKPGSGRGRGRPGPKSGPARRFPNRSAYRAAPYSAAKAPQPTWQPDMFTDRTFSTKLYISNLDYGVSNEDIKELFSEVGELKKYSIHYDRSGRSKGTAEVVFARGADALAAVKRYNNVQLDGKPMKIELVSPPVAPPAAVAVVPQAVNGAFHNFSGFPRGGLGRGGAMGRSRGGAVGRGFGRGRGRGRGRGEKISAEALDADLDKYHSEAMQTN